MTNSNLEIVVDNEEETTYDKGKKLENEFCVFMKKELNWTKARVGAHMTGNLNAKGTSIDVLGERLDERGKKFKNVALFVLIFSLLMLVYGFIWLINDWDNNGIGFMIFSLMLMLGGFVFIGQSEKYNKENAWVECKNLKGKVNINQIDKSIRELNDYRNSGNKDYKFEYHYFVSASGYIENALKYAVEKGLICYEKSGDTFKKVGYWD